MRPIKHTGRAVATVEGAGVHLRRAIGMGPPELFDPYLLLDDFRSAKPADYVKGFPWHPHRGMETITYVLRGRVEHGDSLGNRGVIGPGDVQWMTAGKGIVHQEMPQGDSSGAMEGFQLWHNLPRASKMVAPRYRGVTAAEIPEAHDAQGATVKVIAGEVAGVQGPVRELPTDAEYLDVRLPAGKSFQRKTPRGHTVFAYVYAGAVAVPGPPHAFGNGEVVLFGEGDAVTFTAEREEARFLFVTGKPIGEPIAWGGPIVMNTEEELKAAFDQLHRGTFLDGGP